MKNEHSSFSNIKRGLQFSLVFLAVLVFGITLSDSRVLAEQTSSDIMPNNQGKDTRSSASDKNGNLPDESCIGYDRQLNQLTVDCGTLRLGELNLLLTNSQVLEEKPQRTWLLKADLLVGPNATLIIDSRDVGWLKLENPHGITAEGNLIIDSVKVTSWNSTINNYANTTGKEPRSFLFADVANSNGQMNITNSEIGYLGAAYDGHQGISYHGGSGSIIKNNEIHHMWYGFFSGGIGRMVIENNTIHDNAKYGLDPHTGTHDLIIRKNTIYNIKNPLDTDHPYRGFGIICALNCTRITIEGNNVSNAGGAGIMLTENTTKSKITSNTVSNSFIGISLYNNTNFNSIEGNTLTNNTSGVKIELNSSNNLFRNNVIHNTSPGAECVILKSEEVSCGFPIE